ncbi:type II secretion system F family protein [Ramlibacter sp.]|uniref:type II secretion system F family protein n=1 Tax=Ramlibacter sp. TaxID=1917967 RepID=UPI0017F41D04|nr:type II secretion system F family protein [Ramlibacter sp.]MBA2676227.1 type II secretion system F family protein [Ramlibacter sp.]
MSMILPSLIFVSVVCGCAGLYLWLAPTRAEQRLQAAHAIGGGETGWRETIVRITGPFARLSTPQGDWENSPLRLRFFHAGIRHPDARYVYFGAKTLLPLLFASIAFFALRGVNQAPLTLFFYVLLAALAGCYLPNLGLTMAVRARQREIFESFPDAADLMLVCIEAGLGLDAGLTKVAEEMRRKSVALAEEVHLTNLEMRAGASRDKAFRNLAKRTGVEELSTFATMLTQADKFGTSIGDSLRVFSDDLRHKRQMRAEELASKIPTKMLFPLVLCIFPSISLVILGPAVIRMVRMMGPMLNGS